MREGTCPPLLLGEDVPVVVRKTSGKRPYKICEKATGKIVGSSTTKGKAESSARARNAAHFTGWKPTKKR